jgi:DNA-binding IclR family transcriptional regulator
MLQLTVIAERIRGEFREMPGLVLTAAQACRLWRLDGSTCHTTLAQLVEAGFLCRKADGTYGRASDLAVRPRMAKAGIQFIELGQSASSTQLPASGQLQNR